jgi:GPH family glycoside/pentoside/hexuronide:cation symporter
MRLGNYLGDGAGTIGHGGVNILVGMLVYFYTDKAGIAAASAGTIMLISKCIDACTDLGMGYLLDHTESRFGKARPWIIGMAIPLGLIIPVLFMVPPEAGASAKFAYSLTTNVLATAVILTATSVSYGCLLAYITKSTEERSKMGVIRSVFAYLTGMVITILLIPSTNALGGDQRAWVIVGGIMGVVFALSQVITFFANKEQAYSGNAVKDGEEEKKPFIESVKLLFHNKYWLIMLAAMFFIQTVSSLAGATSIYYAKWIWRNENLVAISGAVGLIPVIIGYGITVPLVKKFGPAKTARIALFVGICGAIVRAIFPYNFIITLAFGCFTSFSIIPFFSVAWVMINNTAEYSEWKYGKRILGMANAANSFGFKVAGGLAGAIVGWALSWSGYDATASAQTPAVLNSIIAISIWLPGILLLVVYILLRFYDLDAKYPQIVKELEERRER